MPLTKSAKIAHRKSERRKLENLKTKQGMRRVIKTIRTLALAKQMDEAKKALPQAYKALDKAAKRGVIKANTASRTKSRLTKLVSRAVQ